MWFLESNYNIYLRVFIAITVRKIALKKIGKYE